MSIIELPVVVACTPWLCWLVAAVSALPLTYAVAAVPMLAPPLHGERGRRRRIARADDGFRLVEPVVGWLGARVRALSFHELVASAELRLRRASYPGGLWPEELLALCAVSALLGLACALWLAPGELRWSIGGTLLGGLLPWLRVSDTMKKRALHLERGLPAAMDLCVLCMGAGADFPASLRFAVRELDAAHPICTEELAMVLEELDLGRTRVEALAHMGERTASEAVRDFVSAVCQAEQKGTPVGESLSLQATALRQKRSVKAEELAAKTAVRLTIPLMMTLVCVILLLFGPFMVRGGL